MTELLSPAGGREALAAAVQNGADAVYMGFGSFNARRSARNFSDEEFLAAVRYCHLRGVKVYLTLNTLVTDRELPALAETARRASEYGVDAILVQDWGVYETLRAVIPDVPLHELQYSPQGPASFLHRKEPFLPRIPMGFAVSERMRRRPVIFLSGGPEFSVLDRRRRGGG